MTQKIKQASNSSDNQNMKKLNVIIQLPIFDFYRKQEIKYTFDGSRLSAPESLGEMDYNVYTVLCEMGWPESVTPSEIARMLGQMPKGGHLTNIKKALLHLGQVSYTFENCLVEGVTIVTPLLHVTKVGRKYLIELPEPFRQQYQAWKWQTIDFQTWYCLPGGTTRKLYEFLERRKNQYKSQDFKIRYSLLEKWIAIKDQRTFKKSMKSLENLWDLESDTLYTFKAKGINQNDETQKANEPIETKVIAAKEEKQNDETQTALVVKTVTNNLTIKENDNEECNKENSNPDRNHTQVDKQKENEQTRKGTNGKANKVENPGRIPSNETTKETVHNVRFDWIVRQMQESGEPINATKERAWLHANLNNTTIQEYIPKFQVFWEHAKDLKLIGTVIEIKKSIPAYIKFCLANRVESDFKKIEKYVKEKAKEQARENKKQEWIDDQAQEEKKKEERKKNSCDLFQTIEREKDNIDVERMKEKALKNIKVSDALLRANVRSKFFLFVTNALGFAGKELFPSDVKKVCSLLAGEYWPEIEKEPEPESEERQAI